MGTTTLAGALLLATCVAAVDSARDAVPPAIELVMPPPDVARYYGQSSGSREITIVGRVRDEGSAVTSLTCNGVAAVTAEGVFHCTVTLEPGITEVTIEAIDAAGNRRSMRSEILYVIDDTAPTITPTLPPVNAAGWIRDSGVLAFGCDDNAAIALCPSSLYLNDGAGQRFTVTAADAAGNQDSLTVTVNVDRRPPLLFIATPSGATTTAATFTITGTARDLTSGVASVRCGDTPATRSGADFTCNVPLRDGSNAIRVHASDFAGNEWSEEIVVRRDPTRSGR